MASYPANELTAHQHYKFLTGSIIPRPIAWISTLNDDDQTVNVAPFSYFNVVAKEIPLVSVSINRKDNEQKDTARNLLSQKEGVIHLVDDSLLDEMNLSSATLAYGQSEIDAMNDITIIDSKAVKAPSIAQAPIRMEVVLHQYLPIRDATEAVISDFFILEVIYYHFAEHIFDQEKEYIDPMKFDPLSRLAGSDYSHIDRLVTLKRPE